MAYPTALLCAALFCLMLVFDMSSAEEGLVKSAAKKRKAASAPRLEPAKYNEIIDFITDAARYTCETLGALITDPTFDYFLRCDLFLEQVEELGTTCDTMVKEIKLTQKQMVENAIDGRYDRELVGHMKKAVKKVLGNKTTSEQIVGMQLSKDMMQWILHVSTHVKGKERQSTSFASGSMDALKMTPAQRKTLRDMGMDIPPEETLEEDLSRASDAALYVYVSAEDKEWARKVSKALKQQKKGKYGQRAKTISPEEMRSMDF